MRDIVARYMSQRPPQISRVLRTVKLRSKYDSINKIIAQIITKVEHDRNIVITKEDIESIKIFYL